MRPYADARYANICSIPGQLKPWRGVAPTRVPPQPASCPAATLRPAFSQRSSTPLLSTT